MRRVVKVVVARQEEGRRIFIIEKALFRMGLEEMTVMMMIILRSKRLPPWHDVEVHVIVAAMGGGRDTLPKRCGRGLMIREASSERGLDKI